MFPRNVSSETYLHSDIAAVCQPLMIQPQTLQGVDEEFELQNRRNLHNEV